MPVMKGDDLLKQKKVEKEKKQYLQISEETKKRCPEENCLCKKRKGRDGISF